MNPLAETVLELVNALPLEGRSDEHGGAVVVNRVAVDLPMESRCRPTDVFRATLPRVRLHTGFETPVGRVRFTLRRGEP